MGRGPRGQLGLAYTANALCRLARRLQQRDRRPGAAAGLDESAARREPAARRPVARRGDLARDAGEPARALVVGAAGQAIEQAAGVGMVRIVEYVADRPDPHQLAAVEHADAAADLRQRAESGADDQDP